MNIWSYILKRLLLMIIVLFGVSCIIFILANIIPADPISAMLGGNAPDDVIERMEEKLGYDKPLHIRFYDFISGAVVGDFGVSLRTNKPVMDDINRYFPATLELTLLAMFFATVFGVTLGILSAVYRNRWLDQISRIFSIIGVSMPVFWTGLLLLLLFYYRLGWLSGAGRLGFFTTPPEYITGMYLVDSLITGNWPAFADALKHILLPAFCLGFLATASIARTTRSSMLDVLKQEYITTARAKGLSQRVIITRHALKNALIPTVTIMGLTFGSLLGGAVLTETVFSLPGLGRYITAGLLSLDYNSVMGGTLYIALVYSLVNLAVDILYAVLDPRMRT
ncbi:MAG: ABC transporter permease [Bacillota bacterium]